MNSKCRPMQFRQLGAESFLFQNLNNLFLFKQKKTCFSFKCVYLHLRRRAVNNGDKKSSSKLQSPSKQLNIATFLFVLQAYVSIVRHTFDTFELNWMKIHSVPQRI